MSALTESTGPFCGSLGCRADADVIIRHPEHGRRAACEDCAADYEVVCRVE